MFHEQLRVRTDPSGKVWLVGNGYRRELNLQEFADLVRTIRSARCRQYSARGPRWEPFTAALEESQLRAVIHHAAKE